MGDNILIDTNILIYSTLRKSPFFAVSQTAIAYYLNRNYEIWISRQTLREYLVVKSRTMLDEKTYDELTLIKEMEYLLNNYFAADEIGSTSLILKELLRKYKVAGKQVHDANIIAACIDNSISHILTNNPAHFKRYSSEEVNIIPLTSFEGYPPTITF